MHEVIVMGSGSSSSTPRLSCRLGNRVQECVCKTVAAEDPRNARGNPSLLIVGPDTNTLVDVGKTFREAALKSMVRDPPIQRIHHAVITHHHMDAMGGLDDLREVQPPDASIALYGDSQTLSTITAMYPYLFSSNPGLWTAQLDPTEIRAFEPFTVGRLEFTAVPLRHGEVTANGFAISEGPESQLVYLSDFGCVGTGPPGGRYGAPEVTAQDIAALSFLVDVPRSLALFKARRISTLFLDAMAWDASYASHSSFQHSVAIARALHDDHGVRFSRVLFTGMTCAVEYHASCARLQALFQDYPFTVACAYDGQTLPLT